MYGLAELGGLDEFQLRRWFLQTTQRHRTAPE
jgi:hypothetical protein